MVHVASRLLRAEVIRVLQRDSWPLADATPLLDRVGLVDITRETSLVAEYMNDTSEPSTPCIWPQ